VLAIQSPAQQKTQSSAPYSGSELDRPRLVVGIVVDQMRYDFLYRYWNRFGKGGFQRMVREGYSFANCNFNYFQTKTGPGHASIYTGTTPAMHGIVGNDWHEVAESRNLYCTQDDSVTGIGSNDKAGRMSPKNMKTGSVGDQIRLATNFRGKSFGISMKDRGSILPAGHGADAAFWFEKSSGNFISSTWYTKLNGKLPAWLEKFNQEKWAARYKDSIWKPLLDPSKYEASSADDQIWERSILPSKSPTFPYRLSESEKKDFEIVYDTPFGNTITAIATKELVKGEKLGKDEFMDFLALSFSCTDAVGHDYGPFAMETEDTYLRLDRDLEDFFRFLDLEVGQGKYLCFLSADHGILETPAFLRQNRIPSITFNSNSIADSLKNFALQQFGSSALISSFWNLQFYLNQKEIKRLNLDRNKIMQSLIPYLEKQKSVWRVFANEGIKPFPAIPMMYKYEAGFYKGRSGDIQVVLAPGVLESGGNKGTNHGAPYSYDSHVPCLWMGWKIQHGEEITPINIEDIAPTLSSLLHIMEPNGSTGKAQSIPLKTSWK